MGERIVGFALQRIPVSHVDDGADGLSDRSHDPADIRDSLMPRAVRARPRGRYGALK